MKQKKKSYYGEKYFSIQRKIGEFGGQANLFKFEGYIRPNYKVVDFGCGGGYQLEHIRCKQKIGIEINPSARNEAKKKGLVVVANVSKIAQNSIDLVISNSTFEHLLCPSKHLAQLRKILKPSGKLVAVVPHQKLGEEYKPDDWTQHLYTWNELTLGNLVHQAGFEVEEVRVIAHQWPPFYQTIQKVIGWPMFHLICRAWALATGTRQLLIVAKKA